MTLRVVLDDLIDIDPARKKKTRYVSRERLLAIASLASQVLTLAVLKKPGLAPIQSAVNVLLTPSTATPDDGDTGSLVLRQIKVLHSKLASARDEEQKLQLKHQIDGLVELLVQT